MDNSNLRQEGIRYTDNIEHYVAWTGTSSDWMMCGYRSFGVEISKLQIYLTARAVMRVFYHRRIGVQVLAHTYADMVSFAHSLRDIISLLDVREF